MEVFCMCVCVCVFVCVCVCVCSLSTLSFQGVLEVFCMCVCVCVCVCVPILHLAFSRPCTPEQQNGLFPPSCIPFFLATQ
jgi:hypothetical protein